MCVVYVQFIPVPINGGFVRIKTNTGIRKEKHRKNKFPNIYTAYMYLHIMYNTYGTPHTVYT